MSNPARAPRTAGVAAAALPIRSNAFIGRETDLATLGALFDGGDRLVTLVGPPGIGKTRLACEYAADEPAGARAFARVYLCDLTEAASLDDVVRALSHTLGLAVVERYDGADAVARLGRSLAERGAALVILDNVEQVVGPLAPAVAAWLEHAPALRVLATSRERLRVAAERSYEMLPLGTSAEAPGDDASPSDAVRLLLDRVARLDRGFSPRPDELALLEEIARQLDGLPLAIELAAARIAVLGAADVLRRLPRRFELLSHGARDAATRLRTLRSAIDGSWDLLEPSARAALADCSVFRGGFSLDAAEHVMLGAHGGPAAFDVVQTLREKSLLYALGFASTERPATTRFGTYLSVRDYAAERLAEAPGGALAAETRHGGYYASVAEGWAREVHGPRGPEAIARLVAERENLVVAAERALCRVASPLSDAEIALRVALGLDPLVMAFGPVEPHLALLDRALSAGRAAGADALLCARVLSARGRLRRRRGRLDEGREDQEHAAHVARACGDAALEGLALSRLSSVLHSQGLLDAGLAAATRALALHRAAGDALEEGITLSNIGAFVEEQGRLDESLAYSERALALHRRVGNTRYEAITLATMAVGYGDDGRDARARTFGQRALAAGRAIGDCMVITSAQYTLALLDAAAGRVADAVAAHEDGVAAARQNGNRRFEGIHLGLLGALDAGARSRERLDDALSCLEDAGDWRYGAFVASLRAALEPDDGEALARVDAALEQARRRFDAHPGDPLGAAVSVLRIPVHLRHARAATARGELADARTHRDEAWALAAAYDDAPARASAPPRTMDARFAYAIARRALDADAADAGLAAPGEPLRVHPSGDWFEPPRGARVACRKRQAIRLLLVCLVDARVRAPGVSLSSAELLAAGWPGERILPAAAQLRLRVSLTRLRQLGLREILQTRDDGHLLDPDVPIRVADAT